MSRPAVPFWVELLCTECGTGGQGRFVRSGRNFRDEMVRNARSEGWVFQGGEAFCKPACVKAYAERQKARAA